MKTGIPIEWIAIAAKMERERKFLVDMADIGFKRVNEFFFEKDKRMWGFEHYLFVPFNHSVCIEGEKIVSHHKGFAITEFTNDVSFEEYVFTQKSALRKLYCAALSGLDKSTYKVESILNV